MSAREYLLLLRKRWRFVAACLLVGVGGAVAVNAIATPKYTASIQLFVSAKSDASDLANLAQGGQFTQERVQSYADIVNSPEVASAVAAQLNNGLSAKQTADEVSASAPLNTVLVNVDVIDSSPSRAQAIANAVGDEFSSFVDTLETPDGSSSSPVKVSVVKRASLPTTPSSPRKDLNLALGFLIGLVAGVGAAVLRETLDTTVKDPERTRDDLGLPVLGSISYDPTAKSRPLIAQLDPHSTRAEAFRKLRTNLRFIDIDHAPRSILFTSSIPEEGKTTTATNLAIALAQTGMRILLVEADLRRPRIASYLGTEGAVGLTSVLIGQAELADAVQEWAGGSGQPLNVLPSGPVPPNPSELLGSRGMADLITACESTYDLVIVDAPPLLPVTDAAVLATITSGTVVVARHGHCRRDQLTRAVGGLRSVDATIFGVVLTLTPRKGSDAHYYAYNSKSPTKTAPNATDVGAPVALMTSQQTDASTNAPAASETLRPTNGVRPDRPRDKSRASARAERDEARSNASDADDTLQFFRS